MAALLDPIAEYTRRQHLHEAALAHLDTLDATLANGRLACFLAALAAGAYAWGADRRAVWLAVAIAGIFVALALWHGKVLQTRHDHKLRLSFYHTGLRRLAGLPSHHAASYVAAPDTHPYAADLDVCGADGLLPRLCTAQSSAGIAIVTRWSLQATDAGEVRSRQAAVRATSALLDLREDLWVLGDTMRHAVHADLLASWAKTPAVALAVPRRGLFTINAAVFAAFTAWQLGWTGPWPLLTAVAILWGVTRWQRDTVAAVVASLEEPRRELAILSRVVRRLVAERFEAPRLQALQESLGQGHAGAVRAIADLVRWGDWFDAHKNQIFAPIAWLLLWGPHFAHGAQRWRQRHAPRIVHWLESVGEIEALISLGGYAFENPHDVWPEIVENGPLFDGIGLGHPLLPTDRCVRNDVRLDSDHGLWLVSGSNMSGKSTLLRTVGSNAVLAWLGVPVRARRLHLSCMAVGATLRVNDDIHTGTSRFFAEVKRLKQIMHMAHGPQPLLFLLDEILHGTNSHDRALGAAAILATLRQAAAVGLVTTHDLALAEHTERLRGVNVHFIDDVRDGALHFDYVMRPGTVQKSNGLAILAAAGLYPFTP